MLATHVCQREATKCFLSIKTLNVFDLIREEKLYVKVAKIYSKKESPICELVEKENKLVLVLLSDLRRQ